MAELTTTTRSARRLYRGKHLLDLSAGLLLSIATAPLVAILGVVSMIRFGSWPLFIHERIGLRERRFRIIKLRSLPSSVEPYTSRDQLDSTQIARWQRFVRTTHFDELPQLWQVVSGSMSLVGPRPMIESIVDRMDAEFVTTRHSVRPGLTGLWQISVDGGDILLDTNDLDTLYVAHASLRLDLRILFITALQSFGYRDYTRAELRAWLHVPPTPAPAPAPMLPDERRARMTTGAGANAPAPVVKASNASITESHDSVPDYAQAKSVPVVE